MRKSKNIIDNNRTYTKEEAVKLVKRTSYSKFVGSLEMHATVNKVGVSADVTLPHGTGKEVVVEVADEKTLVKLENNNVDFDVLLATAEMMPKLVKFARVLGPKGLMPNPKNGTVIKDVKDANKFSANKIKVKTEKKAPLIHMALGKLDVEDTKLIENLDAVINAVGKNRFMKLYLNSSMGPSVKVTI